MWTLARLLIKTDRMRSIVLVVDAQVALLQPAQVGANSTGPIVVIDGTVSVLWWSLLCGVEVDEKPRVRRGKKSEDFFVRIGLHTFLSGDNENC